MTHPTPALRAAARAAAAGIRTAARRPPPPPSAAPAALKAETLKYRRIIWTVAFAAVTVTGTIYGAGLKTQQEWKEKVQQATLDEKLAILENHRADLVRQRGEIEAKLEEVRERMRAGGADDAPGAGVGAGSRDEASRSR